MGSVNSEGDLYRLVCNSKLPSAEKFESWVFDEVLPSIRKTGSYSAWGNESLPQTYIEALEALVAAEKAKLAIEAERKALAVKVEQDAPKVEFADAVADCEGTILIGELAKYLKQNGADIGQNRLFRWLRNNGYLIKGGERKNQPTQWAMEKDLFRVKKRAIEMKDGSIRITVTTKVTGKGQIFILNAFKQNQGQLAINQEATS